MKQDWLCIDDSWNLVMNKWFIIQFSLLWFNTKVLKRGVSKTILCQNTVLHFPGSGKRSHIKRHLIRLDCSKCVWNWIRTMNLIYTVVLAFCPIGSCDCVSLKDCSSIFRSTLVDHPSGYTCWDFDACSLSVFTMEGKSYLAFWVLMFFEKSEFTKSVRFFVMLLHFILKLCQHRANLRILQWTPSTLDLDVYYLYIMRSFLNKKILVFFT